jgi:hypothetical protein
VPTETNERHVAYLDGVRGIAAQIVVVHHFILDFGPGNRKLDAVFNGYTAVLIFLVLSGFVFSPGSTRCCARMRFASTSYSLASWHSGIRARHLIFRRLLIPPSFFVISGFPNFVIQNDISSAVGAGELDAALICDLANSNNVLSTACRARNHAAIGAHVDFSVALQ